MSYIHCEIIICKKNDNFNINGKNRREIAEYIVEYFGLPINASTEDIKKYKKEESKKYYKYISDKTSTMITEDNIKIFKDIVDSIEKNKIQFDSRKLSPKDIKLLIECCKTSSTGHEIVLHVCKQHFIFNSSGEYIFNKQIIKNFNISKQDMEFLKLIYKNYDKKRSAYHDLIIKSKYLATELNKYESANNFLIQGKLNEFLDEFRTVVQVEYNIFSIYPIIKNLSSVTYDGAIDLMINIYTSMHRQSNYHEDKIASLSLILQSIIKQFNTYELYKDFMFCEKLSYLVDNIYTNKIDEYIRNIDVSNIDNAEIRENILYLQENIDNILENICKIYVHTEALYISKSDPTEYIKSTLHIINTFPFTKNPKILERVKEVGKQNIERMIAYMICNAV